MERRPYFITIARQFGSLGRAIAKELSEVLGIEYYDRDILELACRELGKPIDEIEKYDEAVANNKFMRMMYPLGMGDSDMHTRLFQMQQSLIRDIANKGQSCIFVGRCADYVLKDNRRCINVFIYAPYEDRLRNSVDVLGLSKEDAKKMIREVDKARELYHRTYVKTSLENIEDKSILINSSELGVVGTAQLLAEMVRLKFEIED